MDKKEKKVYIECLDEEGWHVTIDRSKNKRNSYKKIFLLLLMIPSFIFVLHCVTFSKYITNTQADPSINVATWSFKINSSSQLSIDLADTIVSNDYSDSVVVPGVCGIINLEVDFSGTKVATNYSILVDEDSTFVPDNLKFYTDDAMSEEFTGFSGSVSLEDIDTPMVKKIYWKWEYTEDDETDDWSNKEIVFGLKAEGLQDV